MIKFSATNALVHAVTPVMEIESKTGGQPFCKRELIINDSWEKDGQQYSNFVSIEFTSDKMSQLDSIFPGQRVDVSGSLIGREYNGKIYNTVRGRLVTPHQAQQQYAVTAPAAPMPGYPQQPQYPQQPAYQAAPMPGGYPHQPAYPQQAQQYAQAQPSPQQPYGGHPSSPGVADLPFKPR